MQQTAFEKGDTVRLKPGGQEMTVSSVDRTGVGCKWLPRGARRPQFGLFEPELLEHVIKRA